jgi:uncharacterized membrane protein YfcA
MAVGTVGGAIASVRFAITVPQTVIRWALFAMVLVSCAGAYFS